MSDSAWPPPIETFVSHEINVALEMLFKENHDSIMRLRFKIPPPNVYPWEYLLQLNFGSGRPYMQPYVFESDNFARDTGHLVDRAKPRTYFALFRFLEWFRENFDFLETRIDAVEAKFKHFKFRAKQQLEYRQVDRKELDRNIQSTLIQAHNMISQRARVESCYKKALLFINTEIGQRGEFNLRKIYGSQTMESDLHPDYNALTTQVASMLQIRRRVEKILENWKNIRVPGMPE
jgi:hypothetical protein